MAARDAPWHDVAMSFRDFVPEQRFEPAVVISPDGHSVAYSTNISGQYNLWVAALDGSGSSRQVTEFVDLAVRTMAWSPDGAHLAFCADQGGDEQYQIYLVDAAGGDPRRLTTGDDRQHELASRPFSNDGHLLAYSGNDRDPTIQDVIIHDLRDGTDRCVESTTGFLLTPIAFSPDDSHLLVIGARSNTDSDACVVDLGAAVPTLDVVTAHDGEVKNVPAAWAADTSAFYFTSDSGGEFSTVFVFDLGDRSAEPFQPAQGSGWDLEALAVSEDSSAVVWTLNERGISVLHRHADDDVTRCELPAGVISPFDVAVDGRSAVMLLSTAARPTEVVVADLTNGTPPRYLTESRPPALKRFTPIEPQLVEYPTHDGRDVPGWLFRPSGDGPFPVMLSIHGGPETQERPTYAYAGLYQYLLASGIGVFAPNVRGSSGYGRSYQTLIHRDWGGAELGDFECANGYLRSLSWVDDERIAVFGGSFGGFAALSCVSRLPDLWAAGVSVVGPSNLHTFVRSVPPTWRALMTTWVGDPESDAELLTERSPLTYADDIVVPLMVIQGANDPRVAKAESDQIVDSLRSRGVEVRYDVYDDEGHGFTKRENEIAALGDIAEFLIRHLAVARLGRRVNRSSSACSPTRTGSRPPDPTSFGS